MPTANANPIKPAWLIAGIACGTVTIEFGEGAANAIELVEISNIPKVNFSMLVTYPRANECAFNSIAK